MAAERVCVAQIGGAHGIRGEVKLKSFTADPLALKDYAPLETEDGAASFEMKSLRPVKGYLVAKLRGVPDRSAAERLTHAKLFVPRQRLPTPADEEFYHADLIGLRALTREGRELGTVHAVHNFGAGDILELRIGESGAATMLPFTTELVPDVDLARGRIIVVPPQDAEAGN